MAGKLHFFREALSRFEEALNIEPNNPLAVDGAIQRFEFTFELAWKAIQEKLYLSEGIEIKSPRQALMQAYVLGWILDERLWLDILDDRNHTSHTYDQRLASVIYSHFPIYVEAFLALCHKLETS